MNVDLLRKIQAQIIDEPERLNMGGWFTDVSHFEAGQLVCQTAACIAGWAVILTRNQPKERERDAGEWMDLAGGWPETKARDLLGLTPRQAEQLFFVDQWPEEFDSAYRNGDKKQRAVAACQMIDWFIEQYGGSEHGDRLLSEVPGADGAGEGGADNGVQRAPRPCGIPA